MSAAGRRGPDVSASVGASVRGVVVPRSVTTTTFAFDRLGFRQRPCCPSSGARYERRSPPFGPLGWAIPEVGNMWSFMRYVTG